MDLANILQKRTECDLEVATIRSLELSLEIQITAKELSSLRKQLDELETRLAPKGTQDTAEISQGREKVLRRRLSKILSYRNFTTPQLHWHLDEIVGTFPARDKSGVNVIVPSSGFPALTMSGWVVPVDDRSAFVEVGIALLGPAGRVMRETQTYQRPDVAAHFDNPSLSSCGFRFEIPMFEIPVGRYDVRISGRGSDGTEMTAQAGTISIA
jgi:hypothetical protein